MKRSWGRPVTVPTVTLLLALALAACGMTAATDGAPVGGPGQVAASAGNHTGDATLASAVTQAPRKQASKAPARATTKPAASRAAPAAPSAAPASAAASFDAAAPSAVPTPGLAAACTANPYDASLNAQNQAFIAEAAAAMTWDVYCARLPAGWLLLSGKYEMTDGGYVTITYRGPGVARLVLQEGAFCSSGLSACEPHDQVLGAAAFGDRQGSLDSLGPGLGFAIYVDPGQAPSWAATGTGMDQATMVKLAAALLKVPTS